MLCAASIVLALAPPNGRILVILAGLALMLGANLVLMRRAFAPLERLSAVMERFDPLHPGDRVALGGPQSEVSVLAETFNEMLDRLELERRESGRRAMLAEEAERRRVASDLHDEIGQSLTALVLQLKQAAEHGSADAAALHALAEASVGILDEVRAVARRLRPEALDDLGLRSALLALAARVETAGDLELTVRLSPDLGCLGPTEELVIYRVAQESLTNVLRHAGARHATLELRQLDGSVRLQVSDDGRGFEGAGASAGGGLRGMRERAVLVGGAFSIRSAPGRGTSVQLSVPSSEAP